MIAIKPFFFMVRTTVAGETLAAVTELGDGCVNDGLLMIFNVIPKVRFGGTECSHEFDLLKSIFSTGVDSPETETVFG